MIKEIKTVKILPGCIGCGNCVVICPEVFDDNEGIHVKDWFDVVKCRDCIKQAEDMCPVQVIKVIPAE